jgi:hypothetical protein
MTNNEALNRIWKRLKTYADKAGMAGDGLMDDDPDFSQLNQALQSRDGAGRIDQPLIVGDTVYTNHDDIPEPAQGDDDVLEDLRRFICGERWGVMQTEQDALCCIEEIQALTQAQPVDMCNIEHDLKTLKSAKVHGAVYQALERIEARLREYYPIYQKHLHEQPVDEWRDIESAPKDEYTRYMVYGAKVGIYHVVTTSKDYELKETYPFHTYTGCLAVSVKGITHWMPLPTPPKEQPNE